MGITRILREEAPSSYSLKLVGYSEFKGRIHTKPYESAVFTASGYQWRLIFYPLGYEKDGGKNHISLYVRLETSASNLPKNWEILVDLKLFVFDQNQKKYLTVQDGTVKRYNESQSMLGIAQFIELSMLEDQKNGYLVNNTCIFGVDIFVHRPEPEKLEILSFIQYPPNNKFTWKILHFSNMIDKNIVMSDQFIVGDRYWRIRTDPKGGKNGDGLSLFLLPYSHLPNTIIASTYAKFSLRILNQRNSNHIERSGLTHFFAAVYDIGHGIRDLISHQVLYDQSKGFLVNDTIILEVEVLCVNQTDQVISN